MVVICDKYSSEYESYFEWYPYPLSDFQKHAIASIVEGSHVLITAHTGSGKTLPAEFAIRYFKERGKRVIYTSPIKALSNQKYYEFSRKYPEITFGLFTGDIKTNPEADVLIMTTEILMNTLFKSKEEPSLHFKIDIENELAAVVFDEIHYINDPERGQTWEKTLLMLPGHIQRIMLSATIDSPEIFAKWCEKATSKPVYLTGTYHRVVPLTHYGFVAVPETVLKSIKNKTEQQEIRKNANKLIMIQSDDGKFQETGYKTIKNVQKTLETHPFTKRKFVLNELASFLKEKEMLPAIGFVFSRKHVELCALEITTNLLVDDSKTPYTIRRDCEQIIRRLSNYEEYLRLPEYEILVKLLEKGIGIHHSGMIPILREIVELFISQKQIQLLFATESFAIGLDCPIKTAFFVGLNKFDGTNERILHSHEYTQMAGRAGRRGIDTIGNVIHCNNLFSLPTQMEYEAMMGGKPQNLVSKFRISYSLVLNLLKTPFSMDDIVQFINQTMLFEELQKSKRGQQQTIKSLEDKVDAKKKSLEWNRTSDADCLQYIECEKMDKAVNKKKKEIQREMLRIQENRTYKEDVEKWKEFLRLQKELKTEIEQYAFMDEYIYVQVRQICDVLSAKGFIENGETITLTTSGSIAVNIAEIHPLIWTECMLECNYFADFSAKQLVGLFSCFTDIKVSQEHRTFMPKSEDVLLKKKIGELQEKYVKYDSLETEKDIRSGIRYVDALNYDIVDESMEWCNCKTEEECKWFIQTKLADKSIQIGDFTKAMMKVVTIAKELSEGPEEWLHKLSEIEGMVLKYIATSQSLYV